MLGRLVGESPRLSDRAVAMVITRRPLAGSASCAPPLLPSQPPCMRGDRNRRRARRARGPRCARGSDRCRILQSPRSGSGILHVHTSWLHAPFRHVTPSISLPRAHKTNRESMTGCRTTVHGSQRPGYHLLDPRHPDTGPDAHRHAIRWWFEIGREGRRPSTRGRGGRLSAFFRVWSHRFGAGLSEGQRHPDIRVVSPVASSGASR